MTNQAEKKKLLIAVHQLNVGGVQKSLLSALRALDYDRFDVTLYVRKDRCELLGQVDPRVGRIIVNKDLTRYYRKPRAVWLYLLLRLRELTGRNAQAAKARLDRFVTESRMAYEKARYFSDGTRYDVAVSYIQGYTAQFVVKHVPADRKIVFFHGSVDEEHALHETIFPAFDRIVAVNVGCRDVLRKLYPSVAGKIDYLENYVDARQIRADAAAYAVDRAGRKTVLCTCGRFTPVKGFDLAVEAAALLRDRGADFLWYFVGDGPERAALEQQIAAYSLASDIIVTGMKENPYPYLAGCDIYVQPSREEAYGLSVAEAQILGRPVVTTATVGGKSLVKDGETGLIAPVTAEGLAEKTFILMNDPALCKKVRDSLSGADYDRKTEAYRDAWARLLSDRPGDPAARADD